MKVNELREITKKYNETEKEKNFMLQQNQQQQVQDEKLTKTNK